MSRAQRRLQTHSSAVLLFSALLLIASSAHAYRTANDLPDFQSDMPVVWAQRDTLTFDLAGDLPEGVTDDLLDRAFTDAVRTWAAINCDGPSALLTWFHREAAEPGDRINTIAFVAQDELPGHVPFQTPAVTEVQYERDGDGVWRIVEADIYLNADRDFHSGAADGAIDLATVLAHELGHVAGLLHPCEQGQADGAPDCDASFEDRLMFPLYYEAGTELGEDDRLGYCFLYPEQRCRPGDRGCVAVESEAAPCTLAECDAAVPDASVAAAPPAEESAGDAAAQAPACEDGDAGDASCPRDLEFASPCTSGNECASGLCVGTDTNAATCTRDCGGDDGVCPSGFRCEAVSGERVCIGPPQGENGCSTFKPASGRRSASGSLLLLIGLALLSRSPTRLRRYCSPRNN